MTTAIVITSINGIIGNVDKLIYRIREDLERFKELTTGKTCLVGLNTYNTFPESMKQGSHGRTWIIVSRNGDEIVPVGNNKLVKFVDLPNVFRDNSVDFVVGGAAIYAATLEYCDTVDITIVDGFVQGNKWFIFPDFNDWQLIDATPRLIGYDRVSCTVKSYYRRKYVRHG